MEESINLNTENNILETKLNLDRFAELADKVKNNIHEHIVGQESLVQLMMIALVADGHVLLEGVPGVAKTLAAKLMARSVDVEFSRIQFTPDLLPSDILGTSVFIQNESRFEFRKGPLFSNIVLIDEINRAPAKTQSALFEVMEETQITIDGESRKLESPFMVLATQNPVEQEGTYRLPEAQLDRFMFKISIDYPNVEQEGIILLNHQARKGKVHFEELKSVIDRKELQEIRTIAKDVVIEEKLVKYIVNIVDATRNNPSIYLGASTRASIALLEGAKALAAISGRDFVTPDDIKYLARPVLEHRIILTPDMDIEGVRVSDVIKQILNKIEIPR
jgi:MoxR-like ATPase